MRVDLLTISVSLFHFTLDLSDLLKLDLYVNKHYLGFVCASYDVPFNDEPPSSAAAKVTKNRIRSHYDYRCFILCNNQKCLCDEADISAEYDPSSILMVSSQLQ